LPQRTDIIIQKKEEMSIALQKKFLFFYEGLRADSKDDASGPERGESGKRIRIRWK